MKDRQGTPSGVFSEVARVEEQLAASLTRTAGEVARSECFDAEQRAEVYVILDTLRADTEAHRRAIGQWVSDRTGGTRDV